MGVANCQLNYPPRFRFTVVVVFFPPPPFLPLTLVVERLAVTDPPFLPLTVAVRVVLDTDLPRGPVALIVVVRVRTTVEWVRRGVYTRWAVTTR